MPGVEEGAMRRAAKGLTLGTIKRANDRKLQREFEGLMEREEQFQIDIFGRGEEFPSWTEVHLRFGLNFVDATGQRDSWLVRPQFTYGAFISRGGPVGILACITRWDVNQRRETTGCMLAIGAVASDFARSFTGELHATFQGYAAPSEAYGDPGQYDNE
jgi:hypothetical protein